MPGNVNFYLKKAEETTGRSLIYLKFKYSGNVLVYTFDQTISPDQWSSSKQRVKNNRTTTKDGLHSLNDLLNNLEGVLLTAYRKELSKGIPAKATLKEALDNFMNSNKDNPERATFYKLLDRFISGEILYKGKEKSPNTIKTYNTLKGHLRAFDKVRHWPVDYNTITLDFLYKYIAFLRTTFPEAEVNRIQDEKIRKSVKSLPVGQNAIAKDVQIIKTVMGKAVTLKETNNLWFEHEDFTAAREETDAVYLTDREILSLWKFDLSYNPRLEAIKDLFVFGCYVGLRYSDYSTVKPENIVQIENDKGEKRLFIKMITAKTGSQVIIPCNPIVLQIFEKYKHNPNRLPKSQANQPFNRAIKEVCKLAGLTETGRLGTIPELPLFEAISSHTARRSFATNTFLSGFPVIDLMKVTGHTTEKAFMKYIRHTKLESARRLDEHIIKQWSSFILKVA